MPQSATTADGVLNQLSPVLRQWWSRYFPSGPTLGQRLAWPTIIEGRHTLLAAPTGTGKTLAALAPIYDQLLEFRGTDIPACTHRQECQCHGSECLCPTQGKLRCLYLAPLKALCNDLHTRLQRDAEQLEALTNTRLSIGLRTGDVAPADRLKLWEDPPDILVITPESLSLLLSTVKAPELLQHVRWVVVDEVHALACNKRGAELAVTLHRLDDLCHQPPQRIGLSATCHPLPVVARWLGGSRYSVQTLSVPDQVRWQLEIVDLSEASQDGAFLKQLLDCLQLLIESHQTLLIFTNVRSLAERIGWALKRRLPHLAEQIGVHHGSIALANRHAVEGQLQRGELRVVLSSTSLELGIDIGTIDHVAFIHATGGATRLLQRLGRAGHRPGASRTGTLFVTTQLDLLEAITTKGAAEDGFLEPLDFPEAPLDVLCQLLIGLAVTGRYTVRAAWDLVTETMPFEQLDLGDFARCLEYVTGGNTQLDIPPRIKLDDDCLTCVNGLTSRLYRTNAGTIHDEPHRQVRLDVARAGKDTLSLGSVPHQFADRLLTGDRFLLNGRVYELKKHERSAIVVQESTGLPAFTRWSGGTWNMPPILAERLWCLRVRLGEALLESEEHAIDLLQDEYHIDEAPARSIAQWLLRQQTFSEIPDRGLFIEATPSPEAEHVYYAVHLPLPAAAAEGLARVLCWRLRPGGLMFPLEPGPLGFLITLPAEFDMTPERWRSLLAPDDYMKDLMRVIATGPVLGRKFMEAAHTGMMLLRTPLRGKVRKVGGTWWGGDKLLNWLRFAAHDFPLLQQAQREAADDYYQARATEGFLAQLQAAEIRLRWIAEPSPLASEWLPHVGSTPENSLTSLDELLLSLGATQQEAPHVDPATLATHA
jgi:ATP-dependent Lhr-like helicase